MKTFALILAACLALPGVSSAADKLLLSRTFQVSFKAPGTITRLDASGATPVSETLKPNAWILVLPKRIALTLTITEANPDEHHYHFGVKIQDELAPVQKVEGWIVPTDLNKMFWLDAYRYQMTMVKKDCVLQNDFVTATIKIDVYTAEPKAKPQPE